MLKKLYAKVKYYKVVFQESGSISVCHVIRQSNIPKNLKQYYADQLWYMSICNEYGIES
jgi:hypothetical protein